MIDIAKMYFIAGGIIWGIFAIMKFFFGKRRIKRLRIISRLALVSVCLYPIKRVIIEKSDKWDEVFLPIAVLMILCWNFYASYISYTREKNFKQRRFLVIGWSYICLFLLGLSFYPYLDYAVKNIVGLIMAIGNMTFLVVYFYRKWKK